MSTMPHHTPNNNLPEIDPDSLEHSARTAVYLQQLIKQQGSIPFRLWMHEALYAPGLGYYTSGNTKLGNERDQAVTQSPAGDFTTAPELSPWFARTLARQITQVHKASGTLDILEFGAGSGILAHDILAALDNPDINYFILELSPDLRARQQEKLSGFKNQVQWLSRLPERFEGCVIANEVLDAMPVELFQWEDNGTLAEKYVTLDNNSQFMLVNQPATAKLAEKIARRMPALPGYTSEINLQAEAWIHEMGRWLAKGVAFLIDYGFPQKEYYHPQRAQGTLMCHLRHHAHGNPLVYPGIQDITAHVDFTAMADAALEGGLEVLGYTSQANFLLNSGLMKLLSTLDPQDTARYAREIGPVQKLLSEAEMGELFKVLAIGFGIDEPLMGFSRGDRRHML
ncbi:SAM-dependent methyltransferase [Advenella faeciporci]|uniref:SAM-dependent methyltransferase n=1 Tax=Advenella faeciporci TaxID=797535 RepID=A0A918JRG4_9BURK|nr:SAM-dependent methyltransferase [Advenella faeciporci]GGW95664.1 SAM-dependent methyltransferase [Advenella faeciporci]